MRTSTAQATHEFSHEALLYESEQEFLDGTLSFIREGLEANEPVLVLVSAHKIALLREELADDAERVHFADMDAAGVNPARLIPAWRDFVDEHSHASARMRGIGEPVWPERSAEELAECHRHEALLNLAFADADGFRLLCPYDVQRLDPAVVATARTTHPVVVACGAEQHSADFSGLDAIAAPFDAPLPAPPAHASELRFEASDLGVVREWVARQAARAGISGMRADDLLLSVNEIAANSIRHGGGAGGLRAWQESEALVCEVSDRGRIDRPLVGRVRPVDAQVSGYGLWLANQLCDLVQVRTFRAGSVVRLHMRAG